MIIGKNKISLSANEADNILTHDGRDYLIKDFPDDRRAGGSGGCLFVLEDNNGQEEDRAIKICRYPVRSYRKFLNRVEKYFSQIAICLT